MSGGESVPVASNEASALKRRKKGAKPEIEGKADGRG